MAVSDCKICQSAGLLWLRHWRIGCSSCQWWISLRLYICAPADANSSSCSAAVPAGMLHSSLRTREEVFSSALQACFYTSKQLFPCHHFKSGKGAAACQHCALAMNSSTPITRLLGWLLCSSGPPGEFTLPPSLMPQCFPAWCAALQHYFLFCALWKMRKAKHLKHKPPLPLLGTSISLKCS